MIFGWIAVTTDGAQDLLALLQRDAARHPVEVRIRATRAFVRISAPNVRALDSIAAETAPIPPSGTAHAPRLPSPTSPIEWCAIT